MGVKFEQLPGKWGFRGCPGRLPIPSSWGRCGSPVVPDQPAATSSPLGARLEPDRVC